MSPLEWRPAETGISCAAHGELYSMRFLPVVKKRSRVPRCQNEYREAEADLRVCAEGWQKHLTAFGIQRKFIIMFIGKHLRVRLKSEEINYKNKRPNFKALTGLSLVGVSSMFEAMGSILRLKKKTSN